VAEKSDKLEKILAMLLIQSMKETKQADKVFALSVAGFSNSEAADLLGTTAATVNQLLYERRKGKPKSAGSKKRSASKKKRKKRR
jgi:DNA-directed RNA polymerase specialized sigma24 family protein